MVRTECAHGAFFSLNKCADSEVYYTLHDRYHFSIRFDTNFATNPTQFHIIFVSKICSNETEYAYQKCHAIVTVPHGSIYERVDNRGLCKALSCYTNSSKTMGQKWVELVHEDWICDQIRKGKQHPMIFSCKEDIHSHCGNTSAVTMTNTVKKCDRFCDTADCSDENFCNGLHYGIKCQRGNKSVNVQPSKICDESPDCDYEDDERGCDINKQDAQFCVRFVPLEMNILNSNCPYLEALIPLFDYTRCAASEKLPIRCAFDVDTGIQVMEKSFYFSPLCQSAFDQTNCTDKTLVAMKCPVNGYMTTISKDFLCKRGNIYNYIYMLISVGVVFVMMVWTYNV